MAKEKWEFILYGLGKIIFTEPTDWSEYSRLIKYDTIDNNFVKFSISTAFIGDMGNVDPEYTSPKLIYNSLRRDSFFSVTPQKPLLEPLWGGDPESEAEWEEWHRNPPKKELEYAFRTIYYVNNKERFVELHFRDCAWREAGCLEIVLPDGQPDADEFKKNEYGESIVPILPYSEVNNPDLKFLTDLSSYCHPELVYEKLVKKKKATMIVGEVPYYLANR